MKGHRGKGKRLTTYEGATLRFSEPELPPEPEPSDEAPDGSGDAGGSEPAAAGGDAVQASAATNGPAAAVAPDGAPGSGAAAAPSAKGLRTEPRGEISTTGLPRTGGGGVDFEIERAKGDADEVIDPEQLNLF